MWKPLSVVTCTFSGVGFRSSRDFSGPYLSKLDIVLIQLFFHDLLEYSQHKGLCFSKGHLLWNGKDQMHKPCRMEGGRTECHLS
jgi:hypothetical protein